MSVLFKNYFTVAVRNLVKQRSRTLISLVSLVVGMTCFIFLVLYARYELSYDSFFEHGDRIFQLGQNVPDWNYRGTNDFAATSGAVGPALKAEYPDVAYAVRTMPVDAPLTFRHKSLLGKGLYADRDFLKMFAFSVEEGDRDSALGEPFSLVLTRTLSDKLFGGENPVGQTVSYDNGRLLKVTGVIEDIPGNTHLKFDYLISFLTVYSLRDDIDTAWGILNYNNYLQLKEGVSARDFEAKLPAVVAKYHDQRSKNRRYFLIPLRNIHFETHVASLPADNIDKTNLYLLISIAFLILVISCINYVNLAVARAGARNKEVGIRKTIGATRRQLTKQFLGESFLLTFVSLLASLAAVCFLFPFFRSIAGNGIPFGVLLDWRNAAALLGLLLAVGFLAGGYPAFYLSSLKPLSVLKGSSGPGLSGGRRTFGRILLMFQFGVTIVLVVGAVTIQKQLLFISNRDIGYSRDNVVAVRVWNEESRTNFQGIKKELLKIPLVSAAAIANTAPLARTEANNIRVESESGEMKDVPMVTTYFIDEDYVGVLGMNITAGRNFSRAMAADIDRQVILNETAARMAGIENPVGKKVVKWGRDMRIIGIVKDFHYTSFRTKIEPLMFSYDPGRGRYFLIKIAGRDIPAALEHIDATFRRMSPDFAFDYAFMGDLYDRLYRNEKALGGFILSFSILTMIIAAVGLYGLISFEVGARTREIGIRKILGASVFSVMGLILKKFALLIAAAVLVFLPAAYYFTHAWLEGFVYRIGLNAGLFAASVLILAGVAALSVAGLTLRAAAANPASSLKTE